MVNSDLLQAAGERRDDLVSFLRDLIAIPAESCEEEARCRRVVEEYERLGFDEVFMDDLGTVVARLGSGPRILLLDGHIDTVGVGDPGAWDHDPFLGKREAGEIWGRGAVDELPGVVCMAYGARLAADRGFPETLTVYLTASVMEEHCEGLAHLDLLKRGGLPRPHGVILGEPTGLDVYRGQRGRLEAVITVTGRAAHGARPDLGENALYKAARILEDLEALNGRLGDDPFLGPGTVVATDLVCNPPSRNAVPDRAQIFVDRRLTRGETPEQALDELRSLPRLGDAGVAPVRFESRAWTGRKVSQDKIYPAWVVREDHPLVSGAVRAVAETLGRHPAVGRWGFSTNGVATMGRLGIPTVGFAPGSEALAHTVDERVAEEELVQATAVYARLIEGFPELDF